MPANSPRSVATPSTSKAAPSTSKAAPSTSKIIKSSAKSVVTATTTSPNFAQLSADLRETREASQESFKQLKILIEQLCKRVDNLEKLKQAVDTLTQTSVELENKTDNNERKLIANSVEIQGISRTSDPTAAAIEIGQQINSIITPNDIKKCHFKEVSSNNTTKTLLTVEFYSNLLKQNFVAKGKIFTRSRSKLICQDEQVTIHVNDQLSSYQKKLLFETKALAKVHKFEFVWIFNAQILVRKATGLQPEHVRTFEDLDKLHRLQ